MNNQHLYLLLHIIKNNSNINRLIRENITAEEIGDQIENLLKNNHLFFENKKLYLTYKGEELYQNLSKDYKQRDKSKWIEEEEKSKIDKIDKNFIYLPSENEIHF